MASYKFDPAKSSARVYWRFGERHVTKVVHCAAERDAQRICVAIEETLRGIERGRLVVPDGADPKAFVFSGGKVVGKATSGPPPVATLGELADRYRAEPPGHLEGSTAKMVAIHLRRILEVFPASTSLGAFDAQGYVARRGKATYRGRPIQRKTIEMELQTLRQAWTWVSGRVAGMTPPAWSLSGLSFPKARAVMAFKTWGEIERELARGGLSDSARADLWDCLWLDKGQVRELLSFVASRPVLGFVQAMMAAAAFTGARRSELCRSRIEDWDLEAGQGKVRQKKRDRDREFSFRAVPIHPDLAAVLRGWFASHPGGGFAFAQPGGEGVTWDEATHHFRGAVAGSKWDVVRGWHVLRHSFASNLAAEGVDQRLIDSWMGHPTNIRERYRHVRPDTAAGAISRI